MNNEEKILQMLEKMQGDITELKQGQDAMQEDITQIKEDATITRSATNSLIEWADTVGVITQVKFPIKKAK